MSTLVNTWGVIEANSYASMAEADDFFNTEYLDSAAWTQMDDLDKQRALIYATRLIDAVPWHGDKYFFRQTLEFPRMPPGTYWPWGSAGAGTSGPDGNFFNFLETDEYLRMQKYRVVRATAVQAQFVFRNSGRNLNREEYNTGVVSVSEFRVGISESRVYASPPSSLHNDARDLLRYYRASPTVARA